MSTQHPRRAHRGLFARLCGVVLGALVAGGLVVSMQVPLLHVPSTSHEALGSIDPAVVAVQPLAWPSAGSAALVIPSMGVAQAWHDRVLPIASLAKLMTAYVVLRRLPLAVGQTGPCAVVTPDDVTAYELMKSSGQSSVLVVAGEQLCEIDLLNGLLVHSASNYAQLLATMVSGSETDFVALMNQTAASLGLRGTHYADASGYSNDSVSTALNQARLAALLMRSALVRQIVDQPSVTLPVAGNVASFTPFVGVDNVVGVKSGRTSAAGGCDVMAMTFVHGGVTRIAYVAVLDQRGGDLLGPAGDAALALAGSAVANQLDVTLARGLVIGRVGWGPRTTPFVVDRSATVWWWVPRSTQTTTLHVRTFTSAIHRGEVVGWLVVHGVTTRRIELVAKASASPLSIWQRLR